MVEDNEWCTIRKQSGDICGEEIVEQCECGEYQTCLAGHGEIPYQHICEGIPNDGMTYDPRGERDREIEDKFLDNT